MIEVKHLTKKYGDNLAVSDLSFTIEKGHIYGFLGPNGAGKSTTMNIMTGCLAATDGHVLINGYDIFEDAMEAKKLIGYLPEIPPVYMDRTPKEYLHFVGEAKGISKDVLDEKIREVMEKACITDVSERLIKHLSKGYRQRVGVAQAILGDPEVIILDEPTVGLDPTQIREIKDMIKDLGKDHTIILSSHILPEVQEICDTIMIISHGKLIACDSPENLEKYFAGTTTIDLVTDADEAQIRSILESVPNITNVTVAEGKGGKRNVRISSPASEEYEDDELNKNIYGAFSAAGCTIYQMGTTTASLEDIFIELTKKSNEEFAAQKETAGSAGSETELMPAESEVTIR